MKAVSVSIGAVAIAAMSIVWAWDGPGGASRQVANAQGPYRVTLPLIVNQGATSRPLYQDEFATSASVRVNGGTAEVRVSVTSFYSAFVVVDLETFRGERRIDQQYRDAEAFSPGQTREYVFTVPLGASGAHSVKVGIFQPGVDWRFLYHWNEAGATFLVP
jgi:hypothetical protein